MDADFTIGGVLTTRSLSLTAPAPTPRTPPEVLSGTLQNMAQESLQAGLVEHYQLETYFGEASVSHTIYSPSIHKEEWRLGKQSGEAASV